MRHNPVLMKNRNLSSDPQLIFKSSSSILDDIPRWFLVLLGLSVLLMLQGCICPPPKERIVIQVVRVPVPADCPKPTISKREVLPSSMLDKTEVNRDLKGSVLNQEYLMNRVSELETLLDTYLKQALQQDESNKAKVESEMKKYQPLIDKEIK